jgi:hypothetical protein
MNTGSLLKRFVSFHKNAISGTYEASWSLFTEVSAFQVNTELRPGDDMNLWIQVVVAHTAIDLVLCYLQNACFTRRRGGEELWFSCTLQDGCVSLRRAWLKRLDVCDTSISTLQHITSRYNRNSKYSIKYKNKFPVN